MSHAQTTLPEAVAPLDWIDSLSPSDLSDAEIARVFALTQRLLRLKAFAHEAVKNPALPGLYLNTHYANCADRKLGCLWFDNERRIIKPLAFKSNVLGDSADLARTFVRDALNLDARSVMMYHYLPGQPITRGRQDKQLFNVLKSSFGALKVDVLDYLIVNGESCHSLLANETFLAR